LQYPKLKTGVIGCNALNNIHLDDSIRFSCRTTAKLEDLILPFSAKLGRFESLFIGDQL
jgi:hypothetical protein